MRLSVVKHRDQETLGEFMQKNVDGKSRYFSDEWAATKKPARRHFAYYDTVCHKKWFRDRQTDVHTNTIETTWRVVKAFVPRRRFGKDTLQQSLDECEWRRKFDHNVWEAFWEAARRFTFRVIRRTPEVDAVVHEENLWKEAAREVVAEEKKQLREQERKATEEAKLFNEWKFAAEFVVNEEEELEKERDEKRKRAEDLHSDARRYSRGTVPEPAPLPPLSPPPPPQVKSTIESSAMTTITQVPEQLRETYREREKMRLADIRAEVIWEVPEQLLNLIKQPKISPATLQTPPPAILSPLPPPTLSTPWSHLPPMQEPPSKVVL
uniref:Uncharacterized protein n=1 Tax=Chromera velia CCMP2878 TaxID=1169474 RepID=A0A0G4HJS1_9ALVE|eukprot:Cvel_28363.t1-p1 / transcript=Cvel_28363.t1 / gene=Cvel_28363 / organism=Chromera_velia_CCMP2878 / gene_product=hypothetical protein / transcript_product=hypothetical protein / location=Cvel_scaffold3696:6511-8845(-) / protein_length=322 / sequence_SO=supercontig / SO=protein_coding / is_pseudo=false